jgi:hypothetical protein
MLWFLQHSFAFATTVQSSSTTRTNKTDNGYSRHLVTASSRLTLIYLDDDDNDGRLLSFGQGVFVDDGE